MTTPTPAQPGFMSKLGQLEVQVEQEGVKLIHAAAGWFDHLTWTQVEHLLVPAIKAVNPGVLGALSSVAAAADHVLNDAPSDATAPAYAHADDLARLQTQVTELARRVDQLTADAGTTPEPAAADPVVPPAAA